jgi:hypothetical protein
MTLNKFIIYRSCKHLDGKHTIFGKLVGKSSHWYMQQSFVYIKALNQQFAMIGKVVSIFES